jgi:hypothetical protein
MSKHMFRSVVNSKWNMHSDEMLKALGVRKLPRDGMEPRQIQGITVWVTPAVTFAGRKSSKHRVMCECPDCGKQMSAGRLHQHVCVK